MIKISGMTLADPLTGEESVPVIQNGQNRRATTDMFNVGGAGGVETLSLEQLETLIDSEEIEFGGHYKVTDKDWLLTGIANNKLVDFAGQGITIGKDDTLPVGVEPLILWVDTGLLIGDDYKNIPPIIGYKLTGGDVDGINFIAGVVKNVVTDQVIANFDVPGRLRFPSFMELQRTLAGHALSVLGMNINEDPEYRIVFKYEKSQL